MSMNLTDYHAAIKTWLETNEKLAKYFKSISCYPEAATKLASPCLFFSVDDFEPNDVQPQSGEKEWVLNLTFYVGINVLDNQLGPEIGASDYQILLRDLAMAVSNEVHQSRFGIMGTVKPATVSSVQPDGFDVELEEYELWSVSATQPFITGSLNGALEAEVYIPSGKIMVGYSPDIGEGNEPKYDAVYDKTGE